jgi:peptide/nickel transport system ATP-binding protein
MTPALVNLPPGCAFRNRCPRAAPACMEEPSLTATRDGRLVRCFYPMHP